MGDVVSQHHPKRHPNILFQWIKVTWIDIINMNNWEIYLTQFQKKWHFSASLTCSRNLWLKTNERLSMLKRNNRNLSMAWDRTASQLSHAYFETSQKQPPWFHINLHTHVNKSMLHISQRRHMGEFHIPTAAFQGEKHHPGISLPHQSHEACWARCSAPQAGRAGRQCHTFQSWMARCAHQGPRSTRKPEETKDTEPAAYLWDDQSTHCSLWSTDSSHLLTVFSEYPPLTNLPMTWPPKRSLSHLPWGFCWER